MKTAPADSRRPRARPLPTALGALGFLAALVASLGAHADAASPAATSPSNESADSRWTLDLEASHVFKSIQNPWFLLAGITGAGNRKNPFEYHLNTVIAGGRYDLTDLHGSGPFRGYLQGSVGVIYADIVQGPETYYAGVIGGFRYLFVPGDGTWSPYAEFRGGMGATDASYVFYGQQSRFAFTYMLGFGLRYQPSPRWRFSLAVIDQHMSDGYLTNPNYGFDSVGYQAGVEWRPH